ncbi:MAG: PD-(D/E)XK nuclease family protein [Candidatus Aminicenantes bacterium]|nr:PD-(D/E)XK nuclease family protein [Candidatus Aminicenantes bacterium]
MDLPRGYISYSQINTYQNCPQKYYFSYIEEISPPVNEKIFLGVVFHATLEHYFNQKISGNEIKKQELVTLFCEKFRTLREEREIFWDSSQAEIEDRGISFIKYFENNLAPGITPLMVEKELEVELAEVGVRLKGILDLVEQDFSITDFKTTNAKWSGSRMKRSFLQMVIYKYLFEQSFGLINPKLKLKILYANPSKNVKYQEVFLNPDDIDLKQMFKIIHYVVENISKGVFYKNESYICGFCEFNDICHQLKK